MEGESLILLDTHALVWAAADPKRLSAAARRAILTAEGLAIADITLWELAMLHERGRLRAPGTIESAIEEIVERTGVAIRPVTPRIAAISVDLPDDVTVDPADRLILATGIEAGLPLVTKDRSLRRSRRVKTIW